MTQSFELGQIVMTRSIAEKVSKNTKFHMEVIDAMLRYAEKDWGIVSQNDKQANDWGLENGDRILAAYETCEGDIWIITEWDRSVTTILFPSEY